jgi:hypothetical protein
VQLNVFTHIVQPDDGAPLGCAILRVKMLDGQPTVAAHSIDVFELSQLEQPFLF